LIHLGQFDCTLPLSNLAHHLAEAAEPIVVNLQAKRVDSAAERNRRLHVMGAHGDRHFFEWTKRNLVVWPGLTVTPHH
jgi:hypothetical protein